MENLHSDESDSHSETINSTKKRKKSVFFLRKAKPSDLSIIEEIQNESFPITYDKKFYRSLIEDRLTDSAVAVMRESGEVAGVVSSRFDGKAEYDFFFCENPIRKAYIMTLAVKPKFRRLGIATEMVKYTEKILMRKYDVDSIFLHTECTNESALGFYKKLDYGIVDRIVDYYVIRKKKSDSFLLQKEIKVKGSREGYSRKMFYLAIFFVMMVFVVVLFFLVLMILMSLRKIY